MRHAWIPLAVATWMAAASVHAEEAAGTKEIYARNCTKCHSVTGAPKKIAKGAPDFSDPKWKSSAPFDRLVTVIAKGKGKLMPHYDDKLTPDQIRSLATFVLEIPAKDAAPTKPGR